MRKVLAFIVKLVTGIVFSGLSTMVLMPGLVAFIPRESESGQMWGMVTLGIGAGIAIVILLASTIRRSVGRGFLFLGAALLLLPISGFLLGGRATIDTVAGAGTADNEMAAAAAGAVITGGMAALGGFFGLILGAIAIVAGVVLVLGGRREVIVVEKRKT